MLNGELVDEALNKFAKQVIRQSRSNLSRLGKKNTSNLYGSLGYESKVSKNSFQLQFYMEEYGTFVDEGVQGKSSNAKAPNSPYKFGSGGGKKGGLTNGIRQWVKQKNIQFRNKEGKFTSHESTAYLITRSIYHKGIKTSLFFTKPFEDAFKRLPDEVVEQFGLELDDLLESTLNS